MDVFQEISKIFGWFFFETGPSIFKTAPKNVGKNIRVFSGISPSKFTYPKKQEPKIRAQLCFVKESVELDLIALGSVQMNLNYESAFQFIFNKQ